MIVTMHATTNALVVPCFWFGRPVRVRGNRQLDVQLVASANQEAQLLYVTTSPTNKHL